MDLESEVRRGRLSEIEDDEVYTMSSEPRGPCLIIYNVKIKPESHGSYEDELLLGSVFEDLGFIVDKKEDLTAAEMLEAIKKLARNEEQEARDAAVIVILSHGSRGYISGVDGKRLLYDDVIEALSNDRCPSLEGKPKMFFIQACQGSRDPLPEEDSENNGDVGIRLSFPKVSDIILSLAAQSAFSDHQRTDQVGDDSLDEKYPIALIEEIKNSEQAYSEEASLWVVGGDEVPEMLTRDGKRWIKRPEQGLEKHHLFVLNSRNLVLASNGCTVHEWNRLTKQISPCVATVKPPRKHYAHAFLNNKMYVMAGQINEKNDQSWKYFNVQDKSWSKIYDNRERRIPDLACGTPAVVHNDKIYLILGQDGMFNYSLASLNPTKELWKLRGQKSSREPRSGVSMASCGTYIWFFGGKTSKTYKSDVERYDPESDTFEKITKMPTPRSDLSVAFYKGKFYATGGESLKGRLGVVEIYDPKEDSWETGPSLNCARSKHSCAEV